MSKKTQTALHYGSFAPPLDADGLKVYRKLAEDAPPPIKEAMVKLCEMVEVFQQTSDSKLPGTKHPSGAIVVVPLEDEEVKRIWDHVPWDHECNGLAELFETLPTGTQGETFEKTSTSAGTEAQVRRGLVADPAAKNLRNAAFHLLWFAKELTLDREPLTTNKLERA